MAERIATVKVRHLIWLPRLVIGGLWLLACARLIIAQEHFSDLPRHVGWQETIRAAAAPRTQGFCAAWDDRLVRETRPRGNRVIGLPGHLAVVKRAGSVMFTVAEQTVTKAADGEGQPKKKTFLRSPKHGGVYVVAHRGAHRGIPENSLPAYQKAIELGADFVEIDVRTTKDGKFVSIHNATVNAYAQGASGKVKELTLAELRTLDIGSRVDAKWKGTRIPTFEEILNLCQGKIGIYLDLKNASVPELVKIIKRHGLERDVLWYASFNRLRQLKEVCDRCVPMPDPYFEKNLPSILRRLRPRVVASAFDRISPGFIKTCHENGAIVIADETSSEDWQRVLAWGLDGIQTNDPEKLIGFLQNRKASE